MKTFPSSALSNNRSEVMKAARDGGAVIQLKETNGDVREEFVMMTAINYNELCNGIFEIESMLQSIKGDK